MSILQTEELGSFFLFWYAERSVAGWHHRLKSWIRGCRLFSTKINHPWYVVWAKVTRLPHCHLSVEKFISVSVVGEYIIIKDIADVLFASLWCSQHLISICIDSSDLQLAIVMCFFYEPSLLILSSYAFPVGTESLIDINKEIPIIITNLFSFFSFDIFEDSYQLS